MLCDNCHKNEATIHIQEVAKGKKKSLHLCSECASKKSPDAGLGNIGGFNISQLLYDISTNFGLPGLTDALNKSDATSGKLDDKAPTKELICPVCTWNSEKLRKTGRLGCSNCYKVFKNILDKALPNMHRGKIHIGKNPAQSTAGAGPRRMQELLEFQKQLDQAIQAEEYEKAAEIRDQINDLKEELNSSTKEDKQ